MCDVMASFVGDVILWLDLARLPMQPHSTQQWHGDLVGVVSHGQ
jgi:hypothetical protein